MKKRIVTLIAAVIVCLTASVTVYANELMGYFTPYEVTVTDEVGAVMYNQIWNSDMTKSIMRPLTVIIPSGKNLTVTDELHLDGVLYLGVEYNDYNAYIKSEEVSLKKEIAGTEAAYRTSAERDIIVINESGVNLRKGPSFMYETHENIIPYGTVLKYNYTNSEYESDAMWAYTQYEGVGGWVYIYNTEEIYDCAYILNDSDIYTGTVEILTDGAYLTHSVNPASEKVAENIPAGTVLSFKYFYENLDCTSVFVEHNGTKGWLRTRSTDYKVATGEKGGVYVLAENGLPLYEKPLDESAQPIANVPKSTNLCVDFQYWDAKQIENTIIESRWMHVNYNGTEGWIFSNDISEYCYMFSAYDIKITNENGLQLYAEPNKNAECLSVLSKDDVATCIYETSVLEDNEIVYWLYVDCNGVRGWAFPTGSEASYVENSGRYLSAPFGAPETESTVTYGTAPEFEMKDIVTTGNDLSSKTIVFICIGAAVLVAAIVVIIAVKKKKSK